MAKALKAAYRATCKIIHPDKCTEPDANKAQVMLNAAMCTLESPFARSSYNNTLQAKLEQHERQSLKRRRKQQIGQNLCKKAAAVAQKGKKQTTTSASGSAKGSSSSTAAKGSSSSTAAEASTNHKASAQEAKEMQQEQHASKEPSAAKPSKTEAATSKAGEEKAETKEPAKTGWWDVGGFQVKQFKHWITVRLEFSTVRKFLFKEWQNEQVAKEVAMQFAKQASRKMTEFRLVKTKKLKTEFLTTNGVNDMTGKETIAQLEMLLEEACYGLLVC